MDKLVNPPRPGSGNTTTIWLHQPQKLAVAEHNIGYGQQIWLSGTRILSRKLWCMGQLMREALHVELHPKNINRQDGSSLSRS